MLLLTLFLNFIRIPKPRIPLLFYVGAYKKKRGFREPALFSVKVSSFFVTCTRSVIHRRRRAKQNDSAVELSSKNSQKSDKLGIKTVENVENSEKKVKKVKKSEKLCKRALKQYSKTTRQGEKITKN